MEKSRIKANLLCLLCFVDFGASVLLEIAVAAFRPERVKTILSTASHKNLYLLVCVFMRGTDGTP